MKTPVALFLLLLPIVPLWACGDDEPEEFTGIVHTEPGSTDPVLDDPDDWRPRCGAPFELFCMSPAVPNPATSSVTMSLAAAQASEIHVTIESSPGRQVRDLGKWPVIIGPNGITWDLKDDAGEPLPPGIYRASIRAVTVLGQTWTSFGDIQIMETTP